MTQNVAILTNFMDFNAGYSLSGIVVDQVRMLAKYENNVFLFVNEQFNPGYNKDSGLEEVLETYQDRVHLLKETKFMHLDDYAAASAMSDEHRKGAEEAAETFSKRLIENEVTTIFTHDFIFTGWSAPYALACKLCTKKMLLEEWIPRWFHWVHSVPSGTRDWWDLKAYGMNHRLVFPNHSDVARVADSFKTDPSSIAVIPHIKDIRTWYDFSDETMKFLDKYSTVMSSDIIQVYPVSTDRMSAKQLDLVIRIFAEIKKMNYSVCLIAANQWATGFQRKESVEEYCELAERVGLKYGEDFIFTSEVSFSDSMVASLKETKTPDELMDLIDDEVTEQNFEELKSKSIEDLQLYPTGISKRMLRELQLLSNVFLFPTKEESFGLVGPEAAFSGCLPVLNRSLYMMTEVMSQYPPRFDFGSYHNVVNEQNDGYITAVARAVLNRVIMNEAIMCKAFCRQAYNMDRLYHKFYSPLCL